MMTKPHPASLNYNEDVRPPVADTAESSAPTLTTSDQTAPQLIATKYSLERLLDESSEGRVYSAKHFATGRPVMVRVLLHPSSLQGEALKRFRREAAEIAHRNARIDHQQVVQTFDYGLLPEEGAPYIVTELISGESLETFLKHNSEGRLPLTLAVNLARQIAEGLWAAHRRGVIHHGLNPAKILFAKDYDGHPVIKIHDFGFSKLWEWAARQGEKPNSRSEKWRLYAAPEQAAGHDSDERSDLYSLGVVFSELFSAAGAFGRAGENEFAVIGAETETSETELDGQTSRPERAGNVVSELESLINQLLDEKPFHRPSTAAEVAHQLSTIENALAHRADNVSASTAPSPDQSSPPSNDSSLPSDSDVIVAEPAAPLVFDAPQSDETIHQRSAVPSSSSYELAESQVRENGASGTNGGALESNFDLSAENHQPPPPPELDWRASMSPPTFDLSEQTGMAAPERIAPAVTGETDVYSESSRASKPSGLLRSRLAASVLLVIGLASTGIVSAWWLRKQNSNSGGARSIAAAERDSLPVPVAESQPEAAGQMTPGAAQTAVVLNTDDHTGAHTEQNPAVKNDNSSQKGAAPLASTAKDHGELAEAQTMKTAGEKKMGVNAIPATDVSPSRLEQKQPGRCTISLSQNQVTLRRGGSTTVNVRLDGADLSAQQIKASTGDWANVVFFPEGGGGAGHSSATYSVHAVGRQQGSFRINFAAPCGSKNLTVNVENP